MERCALSANRALGSFLERFGEGNPFLCGKMLPPTSTAVFIQSTSRTVRRTQPHVTMCDTADASSHPIPDSEVHLIEAQTTPKSSSLSLLLTPSPGQWPWSAPSVMQRVVLCSVSVCHTCVLLCRSWSRCISSAEIIWRSTKGAAQGFGGWVFGVCGCGRRGVGRGGAGVVGRGTCGCGAQGAPCVKILVPRLQQMMVRIHVVAGGLEGGGFVGVGYLNSTREEFGVVHPTCARSE